MKSRLELIAKNEGLTFHLTFIHFLQTQINQFINREREPTPSSIDPGQSSQAGQAGKYPHHRNLIVHGHCKWYYSPERCQGEMLLLGGTLHT